MLNNVLSAGGNSVAIANSGTFNVNNGSQTVGPITGNGSFNVTGTATATAPSIAQVAANIGPAATLNLTGPGAVASNLAVANSGNLNITGGSHTVGAVGTVTQNINGYQLLPTIGAVTVSGSGSSLTGQINQSALTINNGASVVLTGPNVSQNFGQTLSAVSSLNISGTIGAWSSKLDVGRRGSISPREAPRPSLTRSNKVRISSATCLLGRGREASPALPPPPTPASMLSATSIWGTA